jgi:hypothetical protein
MGRYRSLGQYRAVLNKRISLLKRNSNKTNKQIAELVMNRAKRFAPQDTINKDSSGETIRGIRVRKMKGGWQTESWVPGQFKQNLFANNTYPYEILNYPKGAYIPASKSRFGKTVKVLPAGSAAVYGKLPVHWRWTGKPGFFTWAVDKTRRDGFKMQLKTSKKAMRAY